MQKYIPTDNLLNPERRTMKCNIRYQYQLRVYPIEAKGKMMKLIMATKHAMPCHNIINERMKTMKSPSIWSSGWGPFTNDVSGEGKGRG